MGEEYRANSFSSSLYPVFSAVVAYTSIAIVVAFVLIHTVGIMQFFFGPYISLWRKVVWALCLGCGGLWTPIALWIFLFEDDEEED
ncbi:hypothetical protein CC86DRAFT_375751 [Ophiobolus disseminans]|uniref:Transmembrane protein n=1 Tax=Ophiobolus disseminans TaxID=1469910 RepID=A0A6A6ZC22_9PLEO|nr:hypothetical protein CC86DRAFT_375751 [Ophiobolus disseminans]